MHKKCRIQSRNWTSPQWEFQTCLEQIEAHISMRRDYTELTEVPADKPAS